MKDKPLLKTATPPAENESPIDGSYPEQQKSPFASLSALLQSHGLVANSKNADLYQTAFTHVSYANEHRGNKSYDRLEFLGDAVLDLVVADLVFAAHPDYDSHQLTEHCSSIVEGRTLAQLAIRMGFAPFVRFSNGEKHNAAYHDHIFEDVFEAFVAAIYLDQGFAFTYSYLGKLLQDYVKVPFTKVASVDWKTKLQEEIQNEFKGGVEYQTIATPGENPSKTFVVVCRVDGVVLGSGQGHNKKQAEIEAAKAAYLARQRNF